MNSGWCARAASQCAACEVGDHGEHTTVYVLVSEEYLRLRTLSCKCSLLLSCSATFTLAARYSILSSLVSLAV